MQLVQLFHMVVAGCSILANVIAPLDKLILPRTFRLGDEHADFAVAVADGADALLAAARKTALNADQPVVFFSDQIHQIGTFRTSQVRSSVEVDRFELWTLEFFCFREQFLQSRDAD